MNETTTEPTADANANAEAPAAAASTASASHAEQASPPAEASATADATGTADAARAAASSEATPSKESVSADANASSEGAPAPAGDPAAAGAPKKRRRRRRKSAAERAAARAAAGLTGDAPAADGEHAEGEEGEGDEAEGDEASAEGAAKTEGADGQPAPAGQQARGKGPRGARGDRGPRGDANGNASGPNAGGRNDKARGPREARGPRDDKKEPRERPAFNYGDVVFGKVTEITDEAIFVDLAGKGRGMFDRRELSIPDEPAQGPDAPSVEDDDDLPPPRAAEAADASAATDAAASASEAQTEQTGQAAAPVAAETASAEAPASEAAPTSAKPREKRIIVARTIVESAEAEAAEGAATSEAGSEKGSETASATAEGAEAASGATGASESTESTDAAATSDEASTASAGADRAPNVPAAAPVLPPVVLELGSVFVGVVHNDGARGGLVVLTRHPRRASKAKPHVSTAFREKTQVEGLVTGVIKGGIEVDVDGLRAFAPRSHMDLRPGADLHHLVGQRLSFDVTQYAKKGRDVVLSRKASLEAEAQNKRADALAKLPIGQVVEGTVRTVVTFGAFIDVGGIEGLVPLSEMSHNRADAPKDVFKVGEKVQIKILRIDEKGKIWLSRRSAVADPWGAVAEKYAAGSRHTGKVVRVQPFGAFVELESGIDGLIHTSDLSIKRIEHPNDVVKVGDSIDVVVSHVDTSNHKIALHPAALAGNPDEAPQKVVVHKMVKVVVVMPEAMGLVVRILGVTGRNARGFIPAGGTGTPRGTELRKIFPIGKELEAKVLEIDPKRNEVKLSIKALAEDTERSSYQQYRAQVKKEAKFGTFGDLLAKSLKKEE